MAKYNDVLLTSEELIRTYTNIDDNVDSKYILPSIYMAQKNDLEGILGTKLTNKLKQMVYEDSIDDNEKYAELLNEYVNDYLAYATIVRLIPIVEFKIGNTGVILNKDEKMEKNSFSETFSLVDYYSNQRDYLAYRLQKYLVENHSDFAELTDNDIADVKANLLYSVNCAIYLGGKRGKTII